MAHEVLAGRNIGQVQGEGLNVLVDDDDAKFSAIRRSIDTIGVGSIVRGKADLDASGTKVCSSATRRKV